MALKLVQTFLLAPGQVVDDPGFLQPLGMGDEGPALAGAAQLMLRVMLGAEHQESGFPAGLRLCCPVHVFLLPLLLQNPVRPFPRQWEQGSLTCSSQAFPQSTSAEQQSLHGTDLILCLPFPNKRLSSGMWVAVRSACGFLAHP